LESSQRRQVRYAPTKLEIETLKFLELSQRRQVRHTPAVLKIEALKSFEPDQRGQVREIREFSIVIPLKSPGPSGPEDAQVEILEVRQVSQTGRELAQSQIPQVQALGLGSPSLLDPPLHLSQILLHDD
jgi:hypothetical protein